MVYHWSRPQYVRKSFHCILISMVIRTHGKYLLVSSGNETFAHAHYAGSCICILLHLFCRHRRAKRLSAETIVRYRPSCLETMADPKEEGAGSVAATGAVVDVRVEALCQFCLKTLKVKIEKWTKMLSQAEYVSVVNEFLEKGEILVLIIQLTPAGALVPSTKFSLASKNKALYVIKKTPEPIKKAGCKQAMIFGDMASFPLDQLTSVVDSVSCMCNGKRRGHLVFMFVCLCVWCVTVRGKCPSLKEPSDEFSSHAWSRHSFII